MSHSSKCRNIIKSFSLFHLPPTEHLSHLFPPSIYVSSSSFSQTPGLQRNISTSHEGAEYNGGETTDPPRLFVVQPRLRPDTLLKTKLNEALSLANSLEDQRDGYFLTDFAKKELPPHAVVQNPLDRSTRGRADTYFGLGTVDNIKCHLNAVESEGELDAVYVNAILSGTQQRNLERAWGKPVLDRMALIIEIFHAHAFTKEAKLQAELAALMYKKTRLVRVRSGDGRSTFGAPGEAGAEVVSARGRGSGGRGFISGAGETELELQRRRISERRTRLLAEIEEVRRTRAVQRSARKRRGSSDGRGLATIAIVGYTNAGKSTLVNVLSDSDLYSDDRLFATVDPRLRGITLPSGRTVLLSDTVGFISDLPVQLVEAFHATLEEVVEADLLVHVLDSSAPALVEQRSAVLQVLEQIGVSEEKIQNMIEVWNKIDLEEEHDLEQYIDNSVDNEEELLSCEVDDMSSECLPVEHNMEESDCASSAEYGKNLNVQVEEETNVGKGICANTKLSTDDELGSGDQDNSLGGLDDHLKKSPNSLGMDGEVLKSSREWAPDVKTSALTRVGLKELLELIDEKLDVFDGKLKVGRIVQRSAFDKKWRPPQSKESIIFGEVEQ